MGVQSSSMVGSEKVLRITSYPTPVSYTHLAQGYLREVRGERVYPIDWTDKLEALKYIDILKVNEMCIRDR